MVFRSTGFNFRVDGFSSFIDAGLAGTLLEVEDVD